MVNSYGKMALMITTLTLDKTGRLVLPKPVRDELQLKPGDSLELESSEERIVLRPARGHARMRKKHGIWVLHGGAPLSAGVVRETIRRVREERERKVLGKTRGSTSSTPPSLCRRCLPNTLTIQKVWQPLFDR